MRNLFARDLIALGVPAAQLDDALDRVTSALTLTLNDQRARWILSSHADAASELRLTGVVDGAIVNLAVDRTFVDERGTRWIVDYKTGRHEGGGLETFLDREQERYRAQLERYATVLHKLDGRPVRMALYFPLLQAWREWGADC
jgi:ATP-dependent exoDNAse (exonuclease V) beta subunit